MSTKEYGAPLVVLMFHGLVERFPRHSTFHETRTCQIRISDFEKCLASCARSYRFARLEDVPRYLNGEATEPGVLITFDDGVSSVCEIAVPLMRKYGAAGTLFVTTGWIDERSVPAIFALEQALWQRAPTRLAVETDGFAFEEDVPSRAAVAAVIGRLWEALFANRCAPLSLKAPNILFDDHPWRDSSACTDTMWQPTSWESLRTGVSSGTLEIGAHGVTHTPWTWLDSAGLESELRVCKARLEAEFETSVETCAYPHGLNDEAVRAQVGRRFEFTFSSAAGVALPGVDKTNIPRFHVPAEWPNGLWSLVSQPLLGRMLRKGIRLLPG